MTTGSRPRRSRVARSLAALALGGLVGFSCLVAGIAFLERERLWADWASSDALDWRDANTRFDPELGWAGAENRQTLESWGRASNNRYGWRSAAPRGAAHNVALFGDSVAWGFRIDDDQVASALLDHDPALRAAGFQVHNLAVSGYGFGQSLLALRRFAEPLEPLAAAVLIVCADNDREDTVSNSRYGRRKPLLVPGANGQLAIEGVPIARRSLRHTYTDSRFVRAALARWPALEARVVAQMGDRALAGREADVQVEAVLAAFASEVRARGAALHIVLVPSRDDFPSRGERYRRMQAHVAAAGLEALDLHALWLETQRDPGSLYIDRLHLGPAGQRALAEVLRARLLGGRDIAAKPIEIP